MLWRTLTALWLIAAFSFALGSVTIYLSLASGVTCIRQLAFYCVFGFFQQIIELTVFVMVEMMLSALLNLKLHLFKIFCTQNICHFSKPDSLNLLYKIFHDLYFALLTSPRFKNMRLVSMGFCRAGAALHPISLTKSRAIQVFINRALGVQSQGGLTLWYTPNHTSVTFNIPITHYPDGHNYRLVYFNSTLPCVFSVCSSEIKDKGLPLMLRGPSDPSAISDCLNVKISSTLITRLLSDVYNYCCNHKEIQWGLDRASWLWETV